MNLFLRLRSTLAALSATLVSELDQLILRLNTWGAVEHHNDGTHADITADSLTTPTATITSLTAETAVASSLVAATIQGTTSVTAGSTLDGAATVQARNDRIVFVGSLGLDGMTLRLTPGATYPYTWETFGGSGLSMDGGGNVRVEGTTQGRYFILTDGVTAPSATVGVAEIYVDVADGDLKVKFGDGVTKTLATDT